MDNSSNQNETGEASVESILGTTDNFYFHCVIHLKKNNKATDYTFCNHKGVAGITIGCGLTRTDLERHIRKASILKMVDIFPDVTEILILELNIFKITRREAQDWLEKNNDEKEIVDYG